MSQPAPAGPTMVALSDRSGQNLVGRVGETAMRTTQYRCKQVNENRLQMWEVQQSDDGINYEMVPGIRRYPTRDECEAMKDQLFAQQEIDSNGAT